MPEPNTLQYRVVDAFTSRAFAGNHAAVFQPDPERPFHRLPE
jgi:predicted PhzF superfamily epimerase YddE/YHI9